ncbi:hypothetical protein FF021_20380, partial [Leptospira noguchii]
VVALSLLFAPIFLRRTHVKYGFEIYGERCKILPVCKNTGRKTISVYRRFLLSLLIRLKESLWMKHLDLLSILLLLP